MNGTVVVEAKRGCGYRKPAKDGVGIYLVGPSTGAPCGRLPFPLGACPVCGGGVHASRGWTWVEPRKLFGIPKEECMPFGNFQGVSCCQLCPMGLGMPEGRHGLIWIGEKFYKTPQEYLAEAKRMGLSRKIKAVPKGFKLGETVVYLAHRFAVPEPALDKDGKPELDERDVPKVKMSPGVFATFRPTGIDLVVADAEQVPEKATKLAEHLGDGARIIQVVHAPEPQPAQAELPLN